MATFLKTIQETIKYWYIPAIIGGLLIALGVYLFTVPLETYVTLAVLFSVSFLIFGILEIYFSVQNRKKLEGWGWYLTSGLLSFAVGILLIAKPEMSLVTLPLFIGFSLLFRSFQGLGFAFELKNYGILKWGNLAIVSILGIVFSFLLIFNPAFTGISLVVFTALNFIFVGIMGILLSYQLRRLKKFPSKLSQELKAKIKDLQKEYYEYLSKKGD